MPQRRPGEAGLGRNGKSFEAKLREVSHMDWNRWGVPRAMSHSHRSQRIEYPQILSLESIIQAQKNDSEK